MAYTTQTNVENYIKRPLTDEEEALFASLLSWVTQLIEIYTGRDFEGDSNNSTRDFDAPDYLGTEVFIDDAISIASVQTLDSDGNVAETLSDWVAYPLNSTPKTSIYLGHRSTSLQRKRYRITGKWGYSASVPSDIEMCATIILAHLINNPEELKTETIEGYRRELPEQIPPTVKMILEAKKKILL